MSLLLDALKQAEENKQKATVTAAPAASSEASLVLQLAGNEPASAAEPDISLLEVESAPIKPVEPEIEPVKVGVTEQVQRASVGATKPAQVDVLAVGKKPTQSSLSKQIIVGLLLLLAAGVASLFLLEQPSAPVSSYQDTLAAQKKKPAKLRQLVIAAPVVERVVSESLASELIPAEVAVAKPFEPSRAEGAIKITKRTRSSALLSQLERAYQALLGHELERAENLYQQVLASQTQQVDALLGLANIASQRQNPQRARALYEKVLRLDATNNTAQIGLLQTYASHDVISQQQVLEELIAKQPNNPAAYLALGHALSEQSKWKAAQQAYFKAFSLHPKNTVYAYNLAVGLDSLGQYKAAKTYYQKALDLNQLAVKPLDLQRVSNRLMELSNVDD